MRAFAEARSDGESVQQAVGQLPWERNIKRMLTFHRAYPHLRLGPQLVALFLAELLMALPAGLQTSLPSIEAIEQALAGEIGADKP